MVTVTHINQFLASLHFNLRCIHVWNIKKICDYASMHGRTPISVWFLHRIGLNMLNYENYIMIIYIIILKYFEYCQIIIPLISPIIYIFRTSIHSSVNIQCPPHILTILKKPRRVALCYLYLCRLSKLISLINTRYIHIWFLDNFLKRKNSWYYVDFLPSYIPATALHSVYPKPLVS